MDEKFSVKLDKSYHHERYSLMLISHGANPQMIHPVKTEIIEMRSLLRDDVKSQNNTILIVGNCSWSTMTKEAFNGGPSTISVILSKQDVLKTNADKKNRNMNAEEDYGKYLTKKYSGSRHMGLSGSRDVDSLGWGYGTHLTPLVTTSTQ